MIPQYKTTDIPVLFQNWYFTFFPVDDTTIQAHQLHYTDASLTDDTFMS